MPVSYISAVNILYDTHTFNNASQGLYLSGTIKIAVHYKQLHVMRCDVDVILCLLALYPD